VKRHRKAESPIRIRARQIRQDISFRRSAQDVFVIGRKKDVQTSKQANKQAQGIETISMVYKLAAGSLGKAGAASYAHLDQPAASGGRESCEPPTSIWTELQARQFGTKELSDRVDNIHVSTSTFTIRLKHRDDSSNERENTPCMHAWTRPSSLLPGFATPRPHSS
jgi:hypothetical protein